MTEQRKGPLTAELCSGKMKNGLSAVKCAMMLMQCESEGFWLRVPLQSAWRLRLLVKKAPTSERREEKVRLQNP
jgi:hypothetical protein